MVGIDDAHVAADAALIDSSVNDWYAVSQRPFVDLVLDVLAVYAGDDQVNSLKCAKVVFNLPGADSNVGIGEAVTDRSGDSRYFIFADVEARGDVPSDVLRLELALGRSGSELPTPLRASASATKLPPEPSPTTATLESWSLSQAG